MLLLPCGHGPRAPRTISSSNLHIHMVRGNILHKYNTYQSMYMKDDKYERTDLNDSVGRGGGAQDGFEDVDVARILVVDLNTKTSY